MGRKKYKKKTFSEDDRERARNFSVGHSWFSQDVNEDDQQSDVESNVEDISDTEVQEQGSASASKNKINLDIEDTDFEQINLGRRIIDLELLQNSLVASAVCAVCKEGTLSLWQEPSAGWATQICFVCSNKDCVKNEITQENSFFTSKKDGHQYEVNKSLVLAMRTIGRGCQAATKFSAVMGLPKPINAASYAGHTKEWERLSEETVMSSMEEAGNDLRERILAMSEEQIEQDAILDCAVSFDGSWQSRGRHSTHGFVSVISEVTGKVLDRQHLSSTCRECQIHKSQDKDGVEYLDWYTKHEPHCMMNHEGSPQSMESKGAVILFKRSVETHGLRYKYFIGDDSKAYNNVVKEAPYGPSFVIVKEECTGHIQKRMGTRLRNVVSQYKGE